MTDRCHSFGSIGQDAPHRYELNQQIFDSSDDWITVLDLEGRILWINRAGQVSLGMEEMLPLLNMRWAEFWQSADRHSAMKAIDRATAGEHSRFQGYRPTLSGEPKWWDSKISPIWGAAGQVERLLCISRDIPPENERQLLEQVALLERAPTEAALRAPTEAALRNSEERFRLFVTTNADTLYKMSADWSEMLHLTGANFLASIEKPNCTWFEQYIPQEEQGKVGAAIEAAIRAKTPFELKHRVIRRDGTIGWTNSRAVPVLDSQGDIVEWFGTASDITGVKQLEADRIRIEANLAFLTEMMADTAPLKTAADIMLMTCGRTSAYLGLSRCLLVKIAPAADEAKVIYDFRACDLPNLLGTYAIADFHTPDEVGELAAGRPLVIHDVAAAPRPSEAADRFVHLGIQSLVSAPFVSDRQWKFVLCAMHHKPRLWHSDEVELLQELAARICLRLERADAEVALQESEAKYRSLFGSIDEGFCILQVIFDEQQQPVDLRYLEVNAIFEQQTGLQNVVGKTVREVIPGIESFWIEIYAQVVRTGESRRFVNHAEPMGRWFDVFAFRMGEPHECKAAALFTDITVRKRHEANTEFLAEINRSFSHLMTPDTIMQTVGAKIGAFLNVPYCNFSTVDESRDEVVLLDRWNAATVPPLPDRVCLSEQVSEAFYRLVRAGETIVSHNTQTNPITNGVANATIGALSFITVPFHQGNEWKFLFSVHDIRPRTWREDEIALVGELAKQILPRLERARAEVALEEDLQDTQRLHDLSVRLTSEDNSQVLYDEILRTAIALMRTDAGTLQVLDHATQELLLLATQGFNRDMTEHFSRVSIHSNTPCGAALQTGDRMFTDFDLPNSDDPDGSLKLHLEAGYASAQSTPLVSRSGRLIGMVSTHWRTQHRPNDRELRFLDLLARQAADLIEQRQAEAERQQLLEREQAARATAEQANRVKDEFLAVLSHELRSPLNPILGWSTLLLNGKFDEAKTRHALATIQRNARLQSELIEDLLDVSRIMRGKLSLNVAPASFTTAVIAAMETVRLAAEAKSIAINANLEPDSGLILGDATRLQQVVWNLLANAVKFTPPGGEVSIQLKRVGSYAHLLISDTGQGIAPDFLPYVFDYFRQADGATTRKFGGLGLGLAIVHHLVQLHGGTVEADSPGTGEGATFIVKLPLIPELPTVKLDKPQLRLHSSLNGICILVVDDEADSRDFVAFVLEQAGATVMTAASATEAFTLLLNSLPDVLLSDIGMAHINGYMFMQQIRALPSEQGGQIPAIALTAYAGDMNQQQAIAAGFQKHLAKPVEPELLIEVISSLIRVAH